MWFPSWQRIANGSPAGERALAHRSLRRRANFRPRLHALEDRRLLSTLTVTNSLDSGKDSLRADIAKASNGDTIVFAPSLAGQTIHLTSGELLIKTNLTISGLGASQLTISGGTSSRVFELAAKHQVSLSGLTIANSGGKTSFGGGIYNAGKLTISGCTLSGNGTSQLGGAIFNGGTLKISGCTVSGYQAQGGGAVYNGGPLTVSGCTVSGNQADWGGAIYNTCTLTVSDNSNLTGNLAENSTDSNGGAVDNLGDTTISNSTVSGNACNDTGEGGGIFTGGFSTLIVIDCTLTDNTSSTGGGAIFVGDNCTVTTSGCTVTNNSAAWGGGIDSAISSGGSLTVSTTYFSGDSSGDVKGKYIDGGGNTFG